MDLGLTAPSQNASVMVAALQMPVKRHQVRPETTVVQVEREAAVAPIMDGKDFRARVAEAVEMTNIAIDSVPNNRLRFQIQEDTSTCIVQVVDNDTDEIIRQIPPEELLAIKENLDSFRGVLFNRAG